MFIIQVLSQTDYKMEPLNHNEKSRIVFGGAIIAVCIAIENLFIKPKADVVSKHIQKFSMGMQRAKDRNFLQNLKKQGKNHKVTYALQLYVESIRRDTLMIRRRELPLHYKKRDIYKHVTGGHFDIKDRSQQIRIELDDVNVLGDILVEDSEPISIFHEMEPIAKTASYYLRAFQSIAVMGVLSYDFQTQKFTLRPQIMGASLKDIQAYYKFMQIDNDLIRIFLVLFGALGVVVMWNPVKKLIKNFLGRIKRAVNLGPANQQLNPEDFFKEVKIKTSKENVYQCLACNKNSTEIVYDCGHLSLCPQCHQKRTAQNGGKMVCMTCKKESNNYVRLYFG